jgi:hypothetical protein
MKGTNYEGSHFHIFHPAVTFSVLSPDILLSTQFSETLWPLSLWRENKFQP